MKPGKKLLNLSICLTTAGALLPGISYAGCSRDDIDHYLSKGFTTDQVTALCTQSPAASDKQPAAKASSKKPGQKTPASKVTTKEAASSKKRGEPATSSATKPAPAVSSAYESNEQFLKTAIEGYDVVLTDNTLTYIRKTCVKVGKEDLFGFIPEACPDVRYTISLTGMEVKKVKRQYTFYGPMVVRVTGAIQRDIVANFNPKNDDDRKAALEQINTGTEEEVLIREGIPADQVKKVFIEIAR